MMPPRNLASAQFKRPLSGRRQAFYNTVVHSQQFGRLKWQCCQHKLRFDSTLPALMDVSEQLLNNLAIKHERF